MRFRYSAEKNGKPVKKAVVYTHDEHRINFYDVDALAVQIIERLQANGYETYIVGGAVRDLILGKKPKDFDIVTAASPNRIEKLFRNSRIIGRRFRLVHVFFGQKTFEVSTFRSIKDGPTSNTFGTIEEDVLRRDFSLNALFYDPLKQLVVDYVDGMKDIHKRCIRPIIALPHIFTDDPVRMIRAVKYGVVAGFRIPFMLRWRIQRQSSLLATISPSRLTEEILKIIQSPHAREIVQELDELGLFSYLQPCAGAMFKDTPNFKTRYLNSLGTLKEESFQNMPGHNLSVLIRDYLEDKADWDGTNEETECSPTGRQENGKTTVLPASPRPVAERYKNAFALARKFVLPMNPPRVELDAAVRLLFSEHGVPIKKLKFSDRRPRFQRSMPPTIAVSQSITAPPNIPGEKPKPPPVEASISGGGESVQGKKRRKRKRRMKGRGAVNEANGLHLSE